jgi:hypothetical protein
VKAKPVLIVFFAGVAAFAAASVYISATVDKADKRVTRVASPQGKYQAVRISVAGGGDKPFCFDSISVMLAIYPEEFAEKNKTYEVYNAPCDTPANRPVSPKVEWLSDTALRVTYAKPGEGVKFIRKEIDVTKTVHMTFVARD